MKFKTPLFVLMALAVALLAFPMFSSEAEAAVPAENDVTMYLYYEGSRIGEVPNTDDPISSTRAKRQTSASGSRTGPARNVSSPWT